MGSAEQKREQPYRILNWEFLNGKSDVDAFISKFMERWRSDRDNKTNHDPRFARMIDRIFTSCDCYHPTPRNPVEITSEQLKQEVRLLTYIWWGIEPSKTDLP